MAKAPSSSDRAIINKQIQIHFTPGSDEIMPGSYFVLDALGETMTSFGNTYLRVEGNTDSTGSPTGNMTLSERRALAVKNYILKNFPGMPATRFQTIGRGASNPMAPNTTRSRASAEPPHRHQGCARDRGVAVHVDETQGTLRVARAAVASHGPAARARGAHGGPGRVVPRSPTAGLHRLTSCPRRARSSAARSSCSSSTTCWTRSSSRRGASRIAFVLASAVALPLGVLMGAFEPINRFFEPIVAPLRYMPISAFIPLLILWFGIYEKQKIAFLFLGVFVYLLPVVVSAIRAVPEELVQTARTLGASKGQVVRTVLLPPALPEIFDSFRVMNAISWTYVILAEAVNPEHGLGYMVELARTHQKASWSFAGLLVIGGIGLLTDVLIRMISRALFRWREKA